MRLSKEEKEKKKKLKRLIAKIRRTKKYKRWKDRILQRDVKSYPKIPKGVQVHHRTEISTLIRTYGIESVRDAINCKDLWRTTLGISLKRGEHFIFTKLGRYKYLTRGFYELLTNWMASCQTDNLDYYERRKKRCRRK